MRVLPYLPPEGPCEGHGYSEWHPWGLVKSKSAQTKPLFKKSKIWRGTEKVSGVIVTPDGQIMA
jgi:hypothetical protein